MTSVRTLAAGLRMAGPVAKTLSFVFSEPSPPVAPQWA